ncbi:uncharacterized protein LOC144488186 [Mustelus asterias]
MEDIQPRSSKRPVRTPAYHNPPAMQCETTQRSEFGPKTLKDQAKHSSRKEYYGVPHKAVSIKSVCNSAMSLREDLTTALKRPTSSTRSSYSSSSSSTKKGCLPDTPRRHREPPTTAAKKRPKAKSVPMETLSTYRKDYPLYTPQSMRPRTAILRWDNLHINRNLPAEFSTTQRDSYIGWDTTQYPRPSPATFKDTLSEKEGTIDTNTVTKGKIENTTITQQDFTPKNICMPMELAGQPQRSLTIQREAPSAPRLPMCKLQAYLLHQRLKGMKIRSRPASVATQ